MLTKQEILWGKGAWTEQQGKGTQENFSATWLTASKFMVMGLVSELSLASHSESGYFLVAHASLNQDRFQPGGFWEVYGTYGLEAPLSF